MFRGLKNLFDSVLAPQTGSTAADEARRLQLATAVLLVEVMKADGRADPAQRQAGSQARTQAGLQAVVQALQRQFGLDEGETAVLVEQARETSHDATDFHAFTTSLNDRFDMSGKLQVVEAMWQVAYADGHLEAHEQHVLWRVADLLHVPHGAYIHAKMRAKAAMAR